MSHILDRSQFKFMVKTEILSDFRKVWGEDRNVTDSLLFVLDLLVHVHEEGAAQDYVLDNLTEANGNEPRIPGLTPTCTLQSFISRKMINQRSKLLELIY